MTPTPEQLRALLRRAAGMLADPWTVRDIDDEARALASEIRDALAARPGAGEAKPCPICQRAGGSLGALCSRHPACPVPTPAPAPDAALAGRPDVSIAPSSLRELADEADRRSRARGIMPSEMGRELHLRDVLRAAADALARGGTTTNQDTNNG